MSDDADWKLEDLQRQLQVGVDLEFWTIPFYLTALYSVVDQGSDLCQLLRSVAWQEMLHLELVANVANAFGADVKIGPPKYVEGEIPHLDFDRDRRDPHKQDPTKIFKRWKSTLGPLDAHRVDTMCVIEFPAWGDRDNPELRPDAVRHGPGDGFRAALLTDVVGSESTEALYRALCTDPEKYSSIGALYNALKIGAVKFHQDIRVRNQVDDFQRYYADAMPLVVDQDGEHGLYRVLELLTVITEQGEGENAGDQFVPPKYANTATDSSQLVDHYGKFLTIRSAPHLPDTYDGVAQPEDGSPAASAQETLVAHFEQLRRTIERRLGGAPATPGFWEEMATLGALIRNCWQMGAIPRFS